MKNNIMKTEPHYEDFNTAKLLKEKGFDEETYTYFLEKDNIQSAAIDWGVTKRKFAINSDFTNLNLPSLSRPEQWQVVEWFWVENGIWISVLECNDKSGFYWRTLEEAGPSSTTFNSPQEAYSAAFKILLHHLPGN